jgi:hypothetical protein
MKTPTPVPALAIVLSLLCAPALAGCMTSTGPEDARAPEQGPAREINRADAIASARKDALRSYGDGWGAQAQAQYRGGFWVVELHATTGYTLRYAISARDGSIHERSMAQ